MATPRCVVPGCDGVWSEAFPSREALGDHSSLAAPARPRRCVARSHSVKRASPSWPGVMTGTPHPWRRGRTRRLARRRRWARSRPGPGTTPRRRRGEGRVSPADPLTARCWPVCRTRDPAAAASLRPASTACRRGKARYRRRNRARPRPWATSRSPSRRAARPQASAPGGVPVPVRAQGNACTARAPPPPCTRLTRRPLTIGTRIDRPASWPSPWPRDAPHTQGSPRMQTSAEAGPKSPHA
jgi:hypothetical protein